MPVRKVHNRGSNIIGQFPSLKLGRMVAFESTLERDYLYLLEFDPQVLSYEEQPLVITYPYQGRLTRYTPDFWVRLENRQRVVECKPETQLHHPDNERKFAAGRQWCQAHGCEYAVVTDRDLRSGHRLANVKLLTRFARQSVPLSQLFCVAEILAGHPEGLCLADLAGRLELPEPEALGCVCHLLYGGQLVTNLEIPLSSHSWVKGSLQVSLAPALPGPA